jgi:hypothetical protein
LTPPRRERFPVASWEVTPSFWIIESDALAVGRGARTRAGGALWLLPETGIYP